MAADATTTRGDLVKILEATSTTTGDWYPADGAFAASQYLRFTVSVGGGTVDIQGADDAAGTVITTLFSGIDEDKSVVSLNLPRFKYVRAVATNPSGTATVYLKR